MTTERRKQPPLVGQPDADVMELLPGDTALGYAGDRMKTLLGSCVAVILTDPRRTVGTMCHIVHVGRPNHANQHNTAYGEVAMQTMFDRLIAVGIAPARCQAYVYGGGNMFPQLFSPTHVGAKNAQWVLNYLHDCGIVVVGNSVGGSTYRKVAWSVGREAPEVEEVQSQMK
ncbi:MAG: chemotaxis protein CheD [Rhodoferax sp.]